MGERRKTKKYQNLSKNGKMFVKISSNIGQNKSNSVNYCHTGKTLGRIRILNWSIISKLVKTVEMCNFLSKNFFKNLKTY